ncbi:hypothetical protein [Streptosporangium roseum]|uniref:hypothetical protein n=1 Tax=Streptosporangium roseum TaxID=2001 RepID=UPI0012DF85A7|nr:hypothetical protein [Streptosporangium roseum]
MPGVHRLARLVAREREKAITRLWDALHGLLNGEQRRVLAELLDVPAGARISTLERLRRPVVKASELIRPTCGWPPTRPPTPP